MNVDWTKNQSTVVDLLRLPLLLLVIMGHLESVTFNPIGSEVPFFSIAGLTNIILIIFNRGFLHIANPMFFMFSGFYFFYNFKGWSWNTYLHKLRKRVNTLLVPYLSWNLLVFCIPILALAAGVIFKHEEVSALTEYLKTGSLHIFADCYSMEMPHYNVFNIPIVFTWPINVPLWFIRDLIILSILTPLVYFISKKTGVFGLLVLIVAFLLGHWNIIPGISSDGLVCFTLGAFLSLHDKNMAEVSDRYLHILLPVSVLLLVVVIVNSEKTELPAILYVGERLFSLTAMFATIGVVSKLVRRNDIKAIPLLTNSMVFLLAAHSAKILYPYSPLSISTKAIHAVIPGSSAFEHVLTYVTAPILAAAICILIYWILLKFLPKISAPFRGYR